MGTFNGLLGGSEYDSDERKKHDRLEAKLKWDDFDEAAKLFVRGVQALGAGDRAAAELALKKGKALMKRGGFFKLPYHVELEGYQHAGREDAYTYLDVLEGRLHWES